MVSTAHDVEHRVNQPVRGLIRDHQLDSAILLSTRYERIRIHQAQDLVHFTLDVPLGLLLADSGDEEDIVDRHSRPALRNTQMLATVEVRQYES